MDTIDKRPGPVWGRQPGAIETACNPGKTTCSPELSTAPKKWARILRLLLEDGASLNRFEAERHGDHTLPSTVSQLQRMGLVIHRTEERVPGYHGLTARVCRYRLSDESRSMAAKLLGRDVPDQ